MKRKLSLLMVLMMVLSLVPTMNASALGYDIKFSKIAEDLVLKRSESDGEGSWTGGNFSRKVGDKEIKIPAYNRNDAPTLVIDFPETVIGTGDYDITTPGKFSVTVDPDVASFLPGYNDNPVEFVGVSYPGDSAGVKVRRVSPYTIEVEVDPAAISVQNDGNGRGHKYVQLPFFIQAQGYGDIVATFETHLMKGFPSIKATRIGTVHKNSSTAMVEKVGNLARNNDIVENVTEYGRIKIVENTIGAWSRMNQYNNIIEIKLDDPNFTFLPIGRTNARLWSKTPNANAALELIDNARTIKVDVLKLADTKIGYLPGARNQVVLDLPIRVARKADVGTDVTVSLMGEVSPASLVIAKYTDYAVSLKAEKVLDVIAGQDVQNKYVAKVVVEESVPGSLLDGRVFNVSFGKMEEKDGKTELKAADAKFQMEGIVRIERLRGTGDINIAGQDITKDYATGKILKVSKAKGNFEVEVNRGSNLPDNRENDNYKTTNRAMRWEFTLPFVVATDFTGDLYLTFDGAGMNKQTVKIATVKAPVTFEVAKTDGGKLADLLIGKQHQEAPDVTIKEVEAGVLQVKDIIRDQKNHYGVLGTKLAKNDLLAYGAHIVDGDYAVIEGDLKAALVDDEANKERMFSVSKKSTKASTIKLSKVKVTLDRTVPYGPYKVYIDAGNVDARHGLTDMIAVPEYFNVVTPYPENKDVKTVFTIGEQKYVQTVSGIETEVMMDVAAQISENRTMLPVRYVAEALGAKVNYDKDTRVATFTKDNAVVSLNIDSDVLYANGSPVKLLAKPMNENGRILLPLVSIAQAFGLTNGNTEDGVNNDIEWDAAAKTVTLFATKK